MSQMQHAVLTSDIYKAEKEDVFFSMQSRLREMKHFTASHTASLTFTYECYDARYEDAKWIKSEFAVKRFYEYL